MNHPTSKLWLTDEKIARKFSLRSRSITDSRIQIALEKLLTSGDYLLPDSYNRYTCFNEITEYCQLMLIPVSTDVIRGRFYSKIGQLWSTYQARSFISVQTMPQKRVPSAMSTGSLPGDSASPDEAFAQVPFYLWFSGCRRNCAWEVLRFSSVPVELAKSWCNWASASAGFVELAAISSTNMRHVSNRLARQ